MTSIDVSDLVLRRRSGFVLGPISFAVPAGGRTALVGPSGSGKTTLLRCLAGLETPASGQVRFGDRVVSGGRRSVAPEKRHIGFVFQEGALWPHLTALQHLRFVEPSLSRASAQALLEKVGLGDLAERRPGKLSAGEAKRLALARALCGDPAMLLLDEPLHSVDVALRDELSLLIRRVAKEHRLTMILVTHDREEALALADEMVILRAGRVVEAGPAARILRAPATAFGAAFLCGATCLPAVPVRDGRLETALGSFARPTSSEDRLALVLLPGDVLAIDDSSGEMANDRPRGRVLQVRPQGEGAVAVVEIGGRTVRVACAADVRAGSELGLGLRAAPRFLPLEEGVA